MAKIIVDDIEVEVPAEYTLLQACEEAGAEIKTIAPKQLVTAGLIGGGQCGTGGDDYQGRGIGSRLADELLAAAGYDWYEVSNWATDAAHRSRHNLAYWTGQDWWGVGPGAHSHVGGVRWWNVKHPAAYAERIAAGLSPAAGRETLDAETRRVEDVLLRTRIADGLSTELLGASGRSAVAGRIADGLVEGADAIAGRGGGGGPGPGRPGRGDRPRPARRAGRAHRRRRPRRPARAERGRPHLRPAAGPDGS